MKTVLKLQTVFISVLANKMLVISAGRNKILVCIANREDLDQTTSEETD